MMERLIGTSGWAYAGWARRGIYPSRSRPSEWLGLLAALVSTVEVTSSADHLPTAAAIARWRAAVPSRFVFAVKMWQAITHGHRLRDCRRELDAFLAALTGLGAGRGPLLMQLPPTLRCDPTLLGDFLVELDVAAGDAALRVAIEFHDPSWLCDPVYDLCDRHGAAIAISDLPRCPNERANDADFVYLRRHGPDGSSRAAYSEAHLDRDAELIEEWQADRDVYAYFLNTGDGHALHDALRLGELLDDAEPPVAEEQPSTAQSPESTVLMRRAEW